MASNTPSGTPLAVAIAGAGRMGQAIIESASQRDELRIAGVWVRDPGAFDPPAGTGDTRVSDDLDIAIGAADVVIDFSLPGATVAVADAAGRLGKPLVCGVSGLGAEQFDAIDRAAAIVPVVYDRNMSQGIAVLQDLVGRAAAILGNFEVEISETHHVHKKDAPSGTALKLGETVARARGLDDTADIAYRSERRGEVPGDHEVVLRSPTERLILGHSVTTRQVFAEGALRAALWLPGRAPGRYDMHDVLFGDREKAPDESGVRG